MVSNTKAHSKKILKSKKLRHTKQNNLIKKELKTP